MLLVQFIGWRTFPRRLSASTGVVLFATVLYVEAVSFLPLQVEKAVCVLRRMVHSRLQIQCLRENSFGKSSI